MPCARPMSASPARSPPSIARVSAKLVEGGEAISTCASNSSRSTFGSVACTALWNPATARPGVPRVTGIGEEELLLDAETVAHADGGSGIDRNACTMCWNDL